MLKQIALAAFAAAVLGASAAVPASAWAAPSGCDDFGCGMNGTQLTGIAEDFADLHPDMVSVVFLPRLSVDQEPRVVVAELNEAARKQDENTRKQAELRRAQEQYE